MKYLVIANPAAGRKKAAEVVPVLRDAFEARKFPLEVRFTEAAGHAAELAADGVRRGFTHVVSLGGDGTTSEIVGAVHGSGAVFGIIPAGTGNDFPKAVGVPLDPRDAVECLFSGATRKTDVAFVDGKCFVNGFGVGMDGAVARDFAKLGLRHLGPFGYVVGAVAEAFVFGGFSLATDGEVPPEFPSGERMLLFGASNGPFQGGRFNLAPGADVSDGYLDVHAISDMNPVSRLVRTPRVLNGKHAGMRGVRIFRMKKLGFRTLKNLPAHRDGEIFVLAAGEHRLEIKEKGIEIAVPEGTGKSRGEFDA